VETTADKRSRERRRRAERRTARSGWMGVSLSALVLSFQDPESVQPSSRRGSRCRGTKGRSPREGDDGQAVGQRSAPTCAHTFYLMISPPCRCLYLSVCQILNPVVLASFGWLPLLVVRRSAGPLAVSSEKQTTRPEGRQFVSYCR